MIMQPDPIDADMVEQEVTNARGRDGAGSLLEVHHLRWREGPSAQLMHVGPYDAEQPSIVALHQAIAAHGARPRGHHHEIYLGDPRRSAPDKLRTILRQPVAAQST